MNTPGQRRDQQTDAESFWEKHYRNRRVGAGRPNPPLVEAAETDDLTGSFPSGTFDLVSAQYFHTPFTSPRARVLRSAAEAVRPGGLLLIVDHGSTAPWSWNRDPDAYYPTPREIAAELALDPEQWPVLRADMPRRRATGPGGRTAIVTDNVLLVQWAGA